MKLTRAAEACITQAHLQRINAGIHENLCVEHVFFGLLTLARYLDPPLNKPEYQTEAKVLRELLSLHVRSIECASNRLKENTKNLNTGYSDAANVIGRATEIAENAGSDLTPEILAKAVLENTTPAIREACEAIDLNCAIKDAQYQQQAPESNKPSHPNKTNKTSEQKHKGDRGPTTSQFDAFFALLASMEDEQHDTLIQGVKKQKGQKVRRRTKIGLFTYRGGTAAAFIQYFLLGLLIPFIALLALEYFTGVVSTAPTPLIGFFINASITLWVFYIIKGINKLLGLISKAFGHFLDIVADCLLLLGLAEGARLAYALTGIPMWIRVVVSICSLLILLIGAVLYQHLTDQGDTTRTKIMFQSVEGTPDMIFFRFLTKELIFPLLLACVFWTFRINAPLWMEKTLWICVFLWGWNILFNMWGCAALRYKASSRKRRGQVPVRFIGSLHIMLLLPGLIVFLHWLFSWFPMKTWVVVLLSIYGVFFLIVSILNLKQIKEDC